MERGRALCGEEWRPSAAATPTLTDDPTGRVCRRCWALLVRRYARLAAQGKLTDLLTVSLGGGAILVLPAGELQRLAARGMASRRPQDEAPHEVVDVRDGREVDLRAGPDPLGYLDRMADAALTRAHRLLTGEA